ncbi:MAG: hypothetical protein DSM106950_19200 [Stigonema ocellatum SAG 48.90 = DSM 106950]|nr:hypothetical protein [Stigonema ocellatum SAG 48.90 = DSM 106950]
MHYLSFSRYKALPCNALVGGSASRQTVRQSLLDLIPSCQALNEADEAGEEFLVNKLGMHIILNL